MKKLITVSMLGLSLAVTGCGAANNAKGGTTTGQQVTAQPATPDATTKTDVAKDNTTTGSTVNNQATNHTATNKATTHPATTAKTEATATAGTTKTDTLEELQKLVDEVVAKVEKATPSGTDEEKMEQYFNHKKMIDDAEDRLDRREDEVEQKYHKNELTKKEWREEEKKLDALDDKLDKAEDKLEKTFGIDD